MATNDTDTPLIQRADGKQGLTKHVLEAIMSLSNDNKEGSSYDGTKLMSKDSMSSHPPCFSPTEKWPRYLWILSI